MKNKIFILLLTCCLALPSAAQDSRGRATATIVQDVLALMPITGQEAFNREMADLAQGAPATIELLCSMMQPAENHANNKVEYAISGVVNYVSQHPQHKVAVLQALKVGAEKAADATASQFLLAQARLLDEEAAPTTFATHAGAAPYSAQWQALQEGGKTAVLAALKSPDRAVRMQALKFATDNKWTDADFAAQVAKCYNVKGEALRNEDIINWLGDNHIVTQEALLLKAVQAGGAPSVSAIEALGKLGSENATTMLIALLGTSQSDYALAALRSCRANISGRVNKAMQTADTPTLRALIQLASARYLYACGPQVVQAIQHPDALVSADALKALPNVVIRSDAPVVADLLNHAPDAQVSALQKALNACLVRDNAAQRNQTISQLMKQSDKAHRYYSILAATATDESVAELSALYDQSQDKAALEALKQSTNYKAAKTLWKAATAGDESALSRYATLVATDEPSTDQKVALLSQALSRSSAAQTKKTILGYLGAIPTLPAFTTASSQLDEGDVAYAAAYACKNIASKASADIDYHHLQSALTKASAIIQANGQADDGYAVDEIKKIMNEAQPVPPTVLSDQEKREGFELLFDGTNLDKWQGNKIGYVPVNGTIFVTANYGNDGNLYTTKEYKDFIFRFEFCFVRPGINNGVGIRTPMNVDAAYDAMCECQILDHDDPIYAGLRDYQVHGSVYGIIPAKRIKHKPLGEWSTEEIRVKGNHITVTVNGEVIVDGDVKEACKGHNMAPDGSDNNPYTVDHHNHPGLFNTKGFISFCGHGPGLKLRNIRVKELK